MSAAEQTMQPLSALPDWVRRALRGVLTDIDDTLSTHGRIAPAAYAALARLRAAGLLVIPITGRPAGWCDHIARMWPVDAVVGENGSLYMRHDDRGGKLRKRYMVDAASRRATMARLGRIDYCEDVPALPREAVDRVVALMQAEGMTVTVSSIHVNGWFGEYDKLTMTRTLLREEFGIDLDADRERFVFVGDSPNDAPMFRFFPYAVGVANVRRFADRIASPPRYVTTREAGAGFVELAELLAPG